MSSLPTSAPSAAEWLLEVIDAEERRNRLAVRHRLVPSSRIDDLPQIADDLVALHSSDPVTVYLSATARMRSPSLAAVDKALYEDRSLIRHHGMRRTLWVSTPEVVRLIHAAATRDLIPGERRRTAALLAASGIDDPERWLDDAAEQVLADLHEHGPSTARELGQRVEALRHPLQLSPGKKWAATQSAHVRVLLALCLEGKLLRGKPVGSWINGAYRYAAADFWLRGGLGDHQPRQAAAELAGRWLRRFGPATTSDMQWWMGWTVARTKQALADCLAVETGVDGGIGWLARDDPGPAVAEPWVAVLPSLDPTTMGWKSRAWYLPAAAVEAFDRNGNAGPTIWVDGRVVGAWAQDRQGEIRTHYFERVAVTRRREVQARVTDLKALVAETRFTVRFPGTIQARLLG